MNHETFDVGIIGGGPAGLMAAEVISQAGLRVTVFDASASVGRKFLLAGKGGLNLTHSEAPVSFLGRYHGGGAGAADAVASWLQTFGPQDLRDWCQALGIETFVGSSGRVFPTSLKAAPLLRAWLHRLRGQGVRFAMRHRWVGWDENGQPRLLHNGQPVALPTPRAWVLALGGASWPQLGSDGAWVPWLRQSGVVVENLQASNCGFEVAVRQADGRWRTGWSDHLRQKFAGAALKNVAATVSEAGWTQRGEVLINDAGIEGNLVYAASSRLREQLAASDATPRHATLWLNL
ncbi:MAG TPA: TIGR03862 family flavoprotein, partial [Rhodocyclaceae bacterium]|nr:TIGR03862 family flavoprotein [Rhodocyclaceae bacterium]